MTSWQVVKMALIGATTALVAATIIVPTEALSATITVHEPDGEGRVFVDVVGTINDEDFKTFKEKTDQIYPIGAGYPKKQVIVTLVSYGGSINPALQIGDLIRKRGLSTFVPGDRTCTSACALIWLAGVPRTVGDTPQIGFHAIYDPTTRQPTGAGNAVAGAYLRDLGVGYKAIAFMTRKGPTSVEWLTPDLTKELGVAWAKLQPPRAIPIPSQLKLQPSLQAPAQIIAAWRSAPQQWPTPTAPASPKPMPVMPPVITLPVRPVIPLAEPLPQQALPTPKTQQPAAKVEEPPIAARPKITDRIEPGSQQAPTTPGAQPAVTAAQKVVLYEEDPADPNGKRFVGSAIWRTEMVTVVPGQPPELVIRADIEVPERKLAMTLVAPPQHRQGPARHPHGRDHVQAAGGFSLWRRLQRSRHADEAGGVDARRAARRSRGQGHARLLPDRPVQPGGGQGAQSSIAEGAGWFDIPVVYSNNRRAILAMEKGPPGERAFADAFEAWKQ